LKLFFYKLTNYEYWPTWAYYSLLIPYFLYLILKYRSFTFFSNVNDFYPDGGLVSYSKFDVYQMIPQKYLPKTGLALKKQLDTNRFQNFDFPVFAKPDRGERGRGVRLLNNFDELKQALNAIKEDTIIQEAINFQNEAGIFFIRKPQNDKGIISSFTTKEFLNVKGDGEKNVRQLMALNPRYQFQIDRLEQATLKYVPKLDEIFEVEKVGNHSRGTRFINSNHLINRQFENAFSEVATQIKGFHYGRFDVKYNTLEELYRGENFKIIELNGVNSEPTHIYDQSTGLFQSLIDLAWHWKMIGEISKVRYQAGYPRMGVIAFFKHLSKKQM
jgi:hypothetical protein